MTVVSPSSTLPASNPTSDDATMCLKSWMCLLARWPIASNDFDTEPPPATSSSGGHLRAAEEEENDETMRYWSTGLPPSSPPPPTSAVLQSQTDDEDMGMLCLIRTVLYSSRTQWINNKSHNLCLGYHPTT